MTESQSSNSTQSISQIIESKQIYLQRGKRKEYERDLHMTQTEWMLLARYNGLPVVSLDIVVADYFPSMGKTVFLRKILDGSIKLPVMRMEDSQKAAKGVYVTDLASYLDERRAEALSHFDRMHS